MSRIESTVFIKFFTTPCVHISASRCSGRAAAQRGGPNQNSRVWCEFLWLPDDAGRIPDQTTSAICLGNGIRRFLCCFWCFACVVITAQYRSQFLSRPVRLTRWVKRSITFLLAIAFVAMQPTAPSLNPWLSRRARLVLRFPSLMVCPNPHIQSRRTHQITRRNNLLCVMSAGMSYDEAAGFLTANGTAWYAVMHRYSNNGIALSVHIFI